MNSIKLQVVKLSDGKVLGLKSNAPMQIVCLALMDQANPSAPRVDIEIVDATPEDISAAGLTAEGLAAGGVDAKGAARSGKMDPTLRARTECPEIIKGSGELSAMLSILSDKVAEPRKGGA